MVIIIDAYNLLRAILPHKRSITDQERKSFITQLNKYAQLKKHKIIIVFDGGWPCKENNKHLTIVYSGTQESADDYIKAYINHHRSQDLLLVTTDRELNNYASFTKIPSIDSLDFYGLMREELRHRSEHYTQGKDSIIKFNRDDMQKNDDLDALMIEASKNISIKSEDFISDIKTRTSKKSQLSKQERALLKKLNKL